MNVPILRIPFSDEDVQFILSGMEEVIRSGQLVAGKKVSQFESAFATFCGTKHAIATNSGTSAIEVALRAHGVAGGTVVVPTNTFMASAFAPIHAGAKVIFSDVTREDFCMDPVQLQEKMQKDTKAVILVDIGGIVSTHLKEIQKICVDHGTFLLEDAAHAHGATFDGRSAGSFGNAGTFSFYPTKVMTTAEGGMITTNDAGIEELSRTYIDQGQPGPQWVHTVFGNNWRMSELHAVMGLQQMKRADWILVERRKVASWYDKKLTRVSGISLVKIPDHIRSAYYKYMVYLDEDIDRAAIKKELKERFSVSLTGEVYGRLCHDQPVFTTNPGTKLNHPSETFPIAEYLMDHHICLPCYPSLTEEEVDHVVESLKEVI